MFNTTIRARADNAPGIAKALVLPDDHEPIRIPSYPNIERTAVLKFKATHTMSVGETADYGEDGLMMIPAPAAPVWNTSIIKQAILQYAEKLNNRRFPPLTSGAIIVDTGSFRYQKVIVGTGAIPLPANDIPLGILGGEYYHYAPYTANSFVRVVPLAATGVTGTMLCNLKYWDGGVNTVATSVILQAGGGTFTAWFGGPTTPPLSCWFRIDSITNIDGVATGSTICDVLTGWSTSPTFTPPVLPGHKIMLPYAVLPERAASTVPWEDVRMTALSLLATNTTKNLNKEGTVQCARLSCTDNPANFGFVNVQAMNSVHPTYKYFGPLEHGTYSFMPPTAESSIFTCGYRSATSLSADLKTPLIDLSHVDYVHMIRLQDPDSATISNMALTTVWHTEFRTSSMLFNIGACSTPLHDYHASVLAVSTFPMFTENWIHVPTILNWLRTNIPKALSAVTVAGYRVVKDKPKQQAKPQVKVVTVQQPKRVAGPKQKTIKVKVKKTK